MITVLRLGHRYGRDKRVSTHVGLVARAFGADGIVFSGDPDVPLLESLKEVVKNWGGDFEARYEKNWRKFIENFEGVRVHLTMYGVPILEKIREIRRASKSNDLLIIVGAEKVPAEIYALSDYNVSVTSQPHSEIASLSIFLHEYFAGAEFYKKFRNAKQWVIPDARGKKLEKI